jgi:hypothetical protein
LHDAIAAIGPKHARREATSVFWFIERRVVRAKIALLRAVENAIAAACCQRAIGHAPTIRSCVHPVVARFTAPGFPNAVAACADSAAVGWTVAGLPVEYAVVAELADRWVNDSVAAVRWNVERKAMLTGSGAIVTLLEHTGSSASVATERVAVVALFRFFDFLVTADGNRYTADATAPRIEPATLFTGVTPLRDGVVALFSWV